MGWHDTAQICLNGHVINSAADRYPEHNQPFCDKCGEKTIKNCSSCSAPIQGEYHVESVVVLSASEPRAPGYCSRCGRPFPWTESKIQAAIELSTEVGGLVGDEAETFKQSLSEIVRDSPRTPLAAARFKKLMLKMGTGAAGMIKDVVVEI